MNNEMSIAEARANLADLLNQAHFTGERTTIKKHGRPFACVATVEDVERLARLEAIALKHHGGNVVELLEHLTNQVERGEL